MFQTITSDLTEFASCVTEDTTHAVSAVTQDAINTLERIDEAIGRDGPSEAEQEATYRMGLRNIYLSPLAEEVVDGSDIQDAWSFEQAQIESYRKTFDVESKTDEITELLKQHEVLRIMFAELVPVEVSYRAFWERYFFRCDAIMIQSAWDFQKQLDAKALSASLETAKEIAAVPGRVVNGVVVQPVNFLAKKIMSSLSTVSTVSKLQTATKVGLPTSQICSRREMEDLQTAITTSNERIAALRKSLNSTRKQLEATEETSKSLEAELASAKAALGKKSHHAKTLANEIKEITISVDNSSNTASSTEVSGFEESSNGEEDASSSQVIESPYNSSDASPPTSTDMAIDSTDIEDKSQNTSVGDESSSNGWNNDEHCYGSDLELLMIPHHGAAYRSVNRLKTTLAAAGLPAVAAHQLLRPQLEQFVETASTDVRQMQVEHLQATDMERLQRELLQQSMEQQSTSVETILQPNAALTDSLV